MPLVRLVDSFGNARKVAALFSRIQKILRLDPSDVWIVWIRNEGEAFSGHAQHQPRLLGPATGDIPACDIAFAGANEDEAAASFRGGLARQRRDW